MSGEKNMNQSLDTKLNADGAKEGVVIDSKATKSLERRASLESEESKPRRNSVDAKPIRNLDSKTNLANRNQADHKNNSTMEDTHNLSGLSQEGDSRRDSIALPKLDLASIEESGLITNRPSVRKIDLAKDIPRGHTVSIDIETDREDDDRADLIDLFIQDGGITYDFSKLFCARSFKLSMGLRHSLTLVRGLSLAEHRFPAVGIPNLDGSEREIMMSLNENGVAAFDALFILDAITKFKQESIESTFFFDTGSVRKELRGSRFVTALTAGTIMFAQSGSIRMESSPKAVTNLMSGAGINSDDITSLHIYKDFKWHSAMSMVMLSRGTISSRCRLALAGHNWTNFIDRKVCDDKAKGENTEEAKLFSRLLWYATHKTFALHPFFDCVHPLSGEYSLPRNKVLLLSSLKMTANTEVLKDLDSFDRKTSSIGMSPMTEAMIKKDHSKLKDSDVIEFQRLLLDDKKFKVAKHLEFDHVQAMPAAEIYMLIQSVLQLDGIPNINDEGAIVKDEPVVGKAGKTTKIEASKILNMISNSFGASVIGADAKFELS